MNATPIQRAAALLAIAFLGGGATYVVLWLCGLAIDKASPANFLPVNRAGNWLHFGLGFGMILLGLALARRLDQTGSRTPHR